MGSGLSIHTMSACVPLPHSSVFEINKSLSRRYDGVWRDPGVNEGTFSEVERFLVNIHESAHVNDVFSTDYGPAVYLLDSLRHTSLMLLCFSIRENPVSYPIRFPLHEHVLSCKIVHPQVYALAIQHRYLRKFSMLWKSLYLNRHPEEVVYRDFSVLFEAFDKVPLLRGLLVAPNVPNKEILDLSGISPHDVHEASACCNELLFIALLYDGKFSNERLLNILCQFARSKNTITLLKMVMQLGLSNPIVIKYVFWKSLHGRLCVLDDNDLSSHNLEDNLPTVRLRKIFSSIEKVNISRSTTSVLNDSSKNMWEIAKDPLGYIHDVDKLICKHSGLETFDSYSSRMRDNKYLFNTDEFESIVPDGTSYRIGAKRITSVLSYIYGNLDVFVKMLTVSGGIFKSRESIDDFDLFGMGICSAVCYEDFTMFNENHFHDNKSNTAAYIYLSHFLSEVDSDTRIGLLEKWVNTASGCQDRSQDEVTGDIDAILDMYLGCSSKEIDWFSRY